MRKSPGTILNSKTDSLTTLINSKDYRKGGVSFFSNRKTGNLQMVNNNYVTKGTIQFNVGLRPSLERKTKVSLRQDKNCLYYNLKENKKPGYNKN